jgi:hypothetical protein
VSSFLSSSSSSVFFSCPVSLTTPHTWW